MATRGAGKRVDRIETASPVVLFGLGRFESAKQPIIAHSLESCWKWMAAAAATPDFG